MESEVSDGNRSGCNDINASVTNGESSSGDQNELPSKKHNEHETHCDNCFNLLRCKKEKILRKFRPEELSSCPIITCRFNCGREFHECKSDEHDLLCAKAKVQCINKEYGCPFVLERGRRARHLETCPASVVVCTMEWNRWPLPPGKCQPFEMDETKLDVAATLRDQRTIAEWKENVPPSLRHLLKTHVNEKHPVMPLGVSGLRIPKSIISKAQLEHELAGGVDLSESTESEHDESSDSPWGWKKSPPGLQESVCNKLRTLALPKEPPAPIPDSSSNEDEDNQNKTENDDDFHSCTSSVAGMNDEDHSDSLPADSTSCQNNNYIDTPKQSISINSQSVSEKAGIADETLNENTGAKKKDVELSLTVEVRTRCQRKPDSMYTFMCSREFRRDEFPNHFSHIHSGIHTQLNGWLLARCPMSNLGCSFGVERMYPFDKHHRVRFNQVVDAFCTVKVTDDNHSDNSLIKKTDDDRTIMSITSLPFELLVHLTKYLDPLSLNCLSMTTRLFRSVCSYAIVERGVVVLQWEKNESGNGWNIAEKKWLFSTSFSPITKWEFGDLGRITNHLLTCPYFERSLPSKPFSYASVTPNEL